MIITQLNGGLGNQMFQYALGRSLAEANNTILKLDTFIFEKHRLRNYALHCFNISGQLATYEEVCCFKNSKNRVGDLINRFGNKLGLSYCASSVYYNSSYVIKEQVESFDEEILGAKGNIYLEGYWQSYKYFNEIKELLLDEFTIKFEQDYQSSKLNHLIEDKTSVAMHFRRGDYVNNGDNKMVHGLCSLEYYERAYAHIREKAPEARLFVFSDDPEWVKNNFQSDLPYTIVNQNGNRYFEDFRLMSKCKHHIIANSSFSWWAAWLSKSHDKIVIAPRKWFANHEVDIDSRFPEEWLLF